MVRPRIPPARRSSRAPAVAILVLGLALAACAANPDGASPTTTRPTTTGSTTTGSVAATTAAALSSVPTTAATASATVPGSTTGAPVPATTVPLTTTRPVVGTTARPTTTVARSTTAARPATTVPVAVGVAGDFVFPVPAVAKYPSYAHAHHDYPATDIIVGCGYPIVAAHAGTITEVRRVDGWVAATDNPALRGGKSVSILGTDGVRYYYAHFSAIGAGIDAGVSVAAGQELGKVGHTGRASGCHLHFALSPPCPGKEWAVQRGVVWPWPYLDAWRAGKAKSPAGEVAAWKAAHPTACADAMADPHASEA